VDTKAFNEALDVNISYAERYYHSEEVEAFTPMLVFFGVNRGEHLAISLLVPFDNNEDSKYHMMNGVGRALHEKYPDMKLEAVFLLSEAWSKQFPKETKALNRPIRDYEDKKEVLVISGLTPDGRNCMAMFQMKRDRDNIASLSDKNVQYCEAKGERMESNLLREVIKGWLFNQKQHFQMTTTWFDKPLTKQKKGSD
jgi:hypothetical protein